MLLIHIVLFSEDLNPFIFFDFREESICILGRVVDVGQAQAVSLSRNLLTKV